MVVAVRAEAVITAQNKVKPGLTAAARELDRFQQRQSKMSAMLNSGAARALGSVGGALAALSAAQRAFKSSLSMEREMYNVQRATDSAGEALKAQEQFLMDLARATGKTKEELAQLYAAAGFAGRPVRELGQFTEYAAKATVAWGTNAQETGQSMAEIGNIYGATQKRIEEIGDAINTVADSSASGEKDLIEILRRVGGSGKIVGISAENMLAFGAALKEVGVGTEVASTGLNAMLTKIAVPDDKFDEALGKAGLKPKKFRQSVEKNATGAILELLGALRKLEGTKRIAVLKDLFGMEYADDIARMVGGYERINKLLAIANDKQKTLGSVRNGFAIALEKDFNRIDRATQSIDAVLKRVGDSFKVIGGDIADMINTSIDAAESAAKRLDKVKQIDADAAQRAGKTPPAPGRPADTRAEDVQALKDIAAGKFDASSLPYVIANAKNDEVRRAAEDAYRRARYGQVDAADQAEMTKRLGEFNSYRDSAMGGAFLKGPAQRKSGQSLAQAEAIRQRIMQREFEDMRVLPSLRDATKNTGTALTSGQRLSLFGEVPVTFGSGKGAKTFTPPKVDLSEAGTTSGASFVNSLNAELDRGIASAAAKIEQLKSMLKFSTSASIKIEVQRTGTGPGGFDVGRQGPN